MPRLKRAANKPPRIPKPNVASSSRQPDIEERDEILQDIEEEEEMMEIRNKGFRWEKNFVKRGVKNEHHVDVQSIGPNHICVQRITAQGALGAEGVWGGSYLTTMPPKRAKQSVWQKLMFCQGVATMNSHRKLKREIRENARRQQRIDH
ncbi:hypothetical protein RHSIM_Rhsim03G0020700 [Rhododendron simsii]|uniref:Uncharacterized protein n=1 Tax=Rhododendron simsii TaxID=118357 RepID=A0A834H3I3_RHOSS|nr:hypothetical protein RHSIM_Rhsim03G0020700 [Rhododendron simsii]